MNRIDAVFQSAKEKHKTAFVPFLTAGDPDIATTMRIAAEIEKVTTQAGVPTVLELGFPYSDPLADGPTIQAAYTRALDRGIQTKEIFDEVAKFRQSSELPIVAMVSYAIVYKRDPEEFLSAAQKAGFDGVIVPDLPVEESATARAWSEKHNFKFIQLVAPTTRPDRLPQIAAASTGFLYYISVTGITGERRSLPTDLPDRVAQIRKHSSVPICIGFGVSEPAQVELLSKLADGVIVGSAIVRRVADLQDTRDLHSVGDFVRTLIQPLSR